MGRHSGIDGSATTAGPSEAGQSRGGSVETAQSFTTQLSGSTAVGPSQGPRHHQHRQHAREWFSAVDLHALRHRRWWTRLPWGDAPTAVAALPEVVEDWGVSTTLYDTANHSMLL